MKARYSFSKTSQKNTEICSSQKSESKIRANPIKSIKITLSPSMLSVSTISATQSLKTLDALIANVEKEDTASRSASVQSYV